MLICAGFAKPIFLLIPSFSQTNPRISNYNVVFAQVLKS